MLLEAGAHGWVVVPGTKYWKLRCTCPAKHQRWVPLTPSNANYGKSPGKLVEASVMPVTIEAS